MKEKTRKTLKVIIIVIAAAAGLIAVQALYQVTGMSLLHITAPKSDMRIKIENFTDEYNRSCDADRQVSIDDYYEGGTHIRCELKISNDISAGDDEIIAFFLTFHNDLGYDSFCSDGINSASFRKYDEVYFDFESIRLAYGDKKVLRYPLSPGTDPENIDAAIYGLGRNIDTAPDTIGKFKGTVYIS